MILTAKEFMEMLKISRSKMDLLIREGIPHMKVGQLIRFDEDEVMKWLNKKYKKQIHFFKRGWVRPGRARPGMAWRGEARDRNHLRVVIKD